MGNALRLNGFCAASGGKHAKTGAFQKGMNDFKHKWVIFHDENGFQRILFRLSHRCHFARKES